MLLNLRLDPLNPSVATEVVAPLCGAVVTFSHYSKDPSRPIMGEVEGVFNSLINKLLQKIVKMLFVKLG